MVDSFIFPLGGSSLEKLGAALRGQDMDSLLPSLGVGLPAAPGLIGNFQFACMVALSFWGVAKNEAFAFAMVYYFNNVGINIVLGLIFLPFMNIPFRQMFKNQGEKKNNVLISN